ncbi:hypothetical protein BC937DRAFT_87073 [Endogone sp. FLAS-F59071]|nr:hypothetical protein BC937DRAFT_87073 [Endogone sp. FLAS-F59071]|eukprot:RUS19702.1 hypothetical protein BC937DRAFT_87073 [Endogone sp. FLAS-F59071]
MSSSNNNPQQRPPPPPQQPHSPQQPPSLLPPSTSTFARHLPLSQTQGPSNPPSQPSTPSQASLPPPPPAMSVSVISPPNGNPSPTHNLTALSNVALPQRPLITPSQPLGPPAQLLSSSSAHDIQQTAVSQPSPPSVQQTLPPPSQATPSLPPPAPSVAPAQPPQPATSQATPASYRPLNVRDALTYLDQVKIQFADQPDVYNKFLDIMKDFKSQAIDTPGVIERVSTLFKGHPSLISGFNTFLPPGYRIECSTDPHEPDTIRVTTPTGTTSTTGGGPLNLAPEHPHNASPSVPGPPYHFSGSSVYSHGPPHSMNSLPPLPPPGGPNPPSSLQQSPGGPFHSMSGPPPQSSGVAGGQASQQGAGNRRAPVEFNHAISYVNKIKNRFSTDPDTYKQFLEILQTYQKEQKSIQEASVSQQVYAQVQVLFKSTPDLLDEFKQFLPDTSGNQTAASSALFGGATQHQHGGPAQPPRMIPGVMGLGGGNRLPPVGNFPPPPSTTGPGDGYGKKSMMIMSGSSQNSSAAPLPGHTSVGKKKRGPAPASERSSSAGLPGKHKRNKLQHPKSDLPHVSPSAAPVRNELPLPPSKPPISAEESEFFDRVKKYIGNKQTYNEFLKVLNLFSQQIVDQNLLVERVESFIGGNKDLFEWFKSFVGYDGKDEIIENVPATTPKPDLMQCKAYGPSYRLLPKSFQSQTCSGRDQLCWEVLNDEYVSHPTWASEDSGFVASKKNQYEESLHRCEEERYEYDLNIEANLNTIALLEPIAKKIATMTLEERPKFRLPAGLGGPSKTIYQRIIKKVYERDRGLDVIEALHNNPGQAVPVVLRRLKQKDEEWKRAQREWNKIWREVDSKNYYKALDYQGITFKSNDKKAIATKSLITEIETLRREQLERRLRSTIRPRHQFEFFFKDSEVFKDVTRLIYSYLDRGGGFTSSDKEKVRKFVLTFLPLFFCVPTVLPDNLSEADEEDDERMADDDDDHSVMSYDSDGEHSTSSQLRGGRRGNRNRHDEAADLLKDVLTRNRDRENNDKEKEKESTHSSDEHDGVPEVPSAPNGLLAAVPSSTNTVGDEKAQRTEGAVNSTEPMDEDPPAAAVPSVKSEPTDEEVGSSALGAKADTAAGANAVTEHKDQPAAVAIGTGLQQPAMMINGPAIPRKRTIFNFFGNSTFYCFFRLYEMAYERLEKIKRISEEMVSDPMKAKRENRAAVELGVNNTRFEPILDMDFTNGNYYGQLLEIIDKLFDSDIDQQTFEEAARYIFGTKAFTLFTIDKVVQSMIKQIQTIMMDNKSTELISLFEKDHQLDKTSPRLVSMYRMKAEEILGSDENVYRIGYNKEEQALTIQLLGKDDYMMDSSPEDKYEDYVASYMDWTKTTEGVDAKKTKPAFLKRNLPKSMSEEFTNNVIIHSGMQYKICKSTYHMFYISSSEDLFARPHARKTLLTTPAEKEKVVHGRHWRRTRWHEWLESADKGWSRELAGGVAERASLEEQCLKLLKGDEFRGHGLVTVAREVVLGNGAKVMVYETTSTKEAVEEGRG